MPHYQWTIKTANARGAGTDASVFLTLYGTEATLDRLELDANRFNGFEAGDRDTGVFYWPSDLGDIRTGWLQEDQSNPGSNWAVDRIEITCLEDGRMWADDLGGAFSEDEGREGSFPLVFNLVREASGPVDGPDGDPDRIVMVPADVLDRIKAGFVRSTHYMPESAAAKLREAFDPDTLMVLAVLLAIWAGAQFTPAGWVADLAAWAIGLLTIGLDAAALLRAVLAASEARSPEELEYAARDLASAILAIGVDVVLGVLTSRVMSTLRSRIRAGSSVREMPRSSEQVAERTRVESERQGRQGSETERPEREGQDQERAERERVAEPVDTVSGIGLDKAAGGIREFPWAATGIGLTAVVAAAGLAYAASKHRSGRELR